MPTIDNNPARPVKGRSLPAGPSATLPADVVDIQPISKSGAHEFYTGVMADTGMRVFVKHNSPKDLFKPKPLAPVNKLVKHVQEQRFPDFDELQDLNEVTFSHFAKTYCEQQGKPYSGLTYQQVFFTDPQTRQPRVGVASPLIDNLKTLDDVPASQVTNEAEAVELTLLRGLVMGDWNCTYRNQNIGVVGPGTKFSDGRAVQEGQVVHLDYGDAGTTSISKLGVPYANRALLEAHPECIRPALDNICKLTPDRIHTMVEGCGRGVMGWSPQLTEYYSRVLSGNLAQLKDRLAKDPDWLTRPTHNPMLKPGHAGAKQFIFRIPAGGAEASEARKSGVLGFIPSAEELAALVLAQKKYPHETVVAQANQNPEGPTP